MPKETPPLDDRKDALLEIIAVLKKLDTISQRRVIRAVIVFMDLRISDV